MTYSAHSPKDGAKAQAYAAHIRGVSLLAMQYAKAAGAYAKCDGAALRQLTEKAVDFHDIGKLEQANQRVLTGKVSAKSLPVNHVDAGAAHWLSDQNFSPLSAAAIQAHHIGFPDFTAESNKGELAFRDECIASETDEKLPSIEVIHNQLVEQKFYPHAEENITGDQTVFLRMLLSCVADADHTDTARHYGKYPETEPFTPLRAEERLKCLDECVDDLQRNGDPTNRNVLRSQMFYACRNADISSGISSCDSPVGSGKTTAVMAHLLAQAQKRGLRRVFVVLPFTNIIRQSVDTYRKMLTLPGERPENVVAELHHRADFESEDARHLTALWRVPIIVTTAVAFFETLASNATSTLRRLHELPGSAIFVDESHAALPAKLLPIAWRWMNVLSNEWSCYWVLASGSLSRFWTVKEIADTFDAVTVPEIVDDRIRCKLSAYEHNRISYHYEPRPKPTTELMEWVCSFPGPRLVILNTVQSAAMLADCIKEKHGRERVEHLSTALKPEDREQTLVCIYDRLADEQDSDWTLVATSCVEAGIDFSFKTGFRELGSLSSLLQAAGRVNREGKDAGAQMWVFRIREDGMLKLNPGLKHAGEVLKGYLDEGVVISPELTTQSLSKEIAMYGVSGKHKKLVEEEARQDFRRVEQGFKVIDSDTRLAVVDADIAARLRYGKMDWRELQKKSVQIAKYKLDEVRAPLLVDDIYHWNLGYDSILGYMAGIVKLMKYSGQAMIV